MKHYKAIIWDFNGTLIDDAQAALASVNDMLAARNLPPITYKQYASYVDTPIINFYRHIFDDLDLMCFDDIAYEFNKGYDKHLKKYPVMENAPEVLEYFCKKGKLQAVISATHIDKVNARLKEFGLYRFFHKTLAHDNLYAEDKTHLAVKYFEQTGLSPVDCVVIGDCVADYQMAEAVGCDCILTTLGHQSRDELVNTKASVIDSLKELINIID